MHSIRIDSGSSFRMWRRFRFTYPYRPIGADIFSTLASNVGNANAIGLQQTPKVIAVLRLSVTSKTQQCRIGSLYSVTHIFNLDPLCIRVLCKSTHKISRRSRCHIHVADNPFLPVIKPCKACTTLSSKLDIMSFPSEHGNPLLAHQTSRYCSSKK